MNVRLWLTNGELGNRVGPEDITGFANSATFDDISVNHVTAAAGGTNGEDHPSTQLVIPERNSRLGVNTHLGSAA